MPKDRTLRKLFIVSLVVTILFPVVNIYLILPHFVNLVTKTTEEEAIRTVHHLKSMLLTDHDDEQGTQLPLQMLTLSPDLGQQISEAEKHFQFSALEVLSSKGEILYSSREVMSGESTIDDAYQALIAEGRPFTKVLRSSGYFGNHLSRADLIKAYVPIKDGNRLHGYFGIYYDVSERYSELNRAILRGGIIPIGLVLTYVSIIMMMIFKLDKSIMEHKRAKKTLKDFTLQLKKRNQELQEFAYVASHDLQEPLRKVMAFSDRVRAKYGNLLDEQGRDYLDRMQKAAGRMKHLINGLLQYSRVTTRAKPFVLTDLSTVANEVLSDLEIRIQERGARVETGGLPTVYADPLQMRQLFQNLISNAIKFVRDDDTPRVIIRSRPLAGNESGAPEGPPGGVFHEISFHDNGIGFDNKYAERIFGVFQKLHGRTEYEGTGIGLSVCRKIMERHGGTISATGVAGAGAVFTVILPGWSREKGRETGDQPEETPAGKDTRKSHELPGEHVTV